MHLDVIPDELRFITGDRTERLPMFSVEELGQAPAKKRAELVPTEEMQTWFNSQGTAASLERLHLSVMPVKQELFDAVCKLKTLTHLEIETFRCESLMQIEQLENLSFLCLSGTIKLKSVAPISKLSRLTSLTLGASNLQKLDFECEMPELKCLILLGSSDYSNLKLTDIEFLRKLPNLKYLAFLNVSLTQANYDVFDGLNELQEVVMSRKRHLPKVVAEKLRKRGVNVQI